MVHKRPFFKTLSSSKNSPVGLSTASEVRDVVKGQTEAQFGSSNDDGEKELPSDTENFRSFELSLVEILGENVKPRVHSLYSKFHSTEDALSNAIEEYFGDMDVPSEGPQPQKKPKKNNKAPETDIGITIQSSDAVRTIKKNQDTPKVSLDVHGGNNYLWTKYIGSLRVLAWVTRPFIGTLKHNQALEVSLIKSKKDKRGDHLKSLRVFTATKEGSKGREIGRLPEELNRILSSLVDLQLIQISDINVLGEFRKLSIGDSFPVQLDFYLTSKAFENNESRSVSSLTTVRFGTNMSASQDMNEADAAQALKIRQHSLLNFLQKMNVLPTSSDYQSPVEIDSVENEGRIKDCPKDASISTYVTFDQLNQFYRSYQESELLDGLPDYISPPSENFSLELRAYQKQGLSWMLSRENEVGLLTDMSNNRSQLDTSVAVTGNLKESLSPLWRKCEWPNDAARISEGTESKNERYFYANIYSGVLSLSKPEIVLNVRGGIIADEMGLGKTISALSLVHTVPADGNFTSQEDQDGGPYAASTTLVVVPMSLLSQWKEEFERSNRNASNHCIVYYGEQTDVDLKRSLCLPKKKPPIIILTTYGVVLSEHLRLSSKNQVGAGMKSNGLFSVKYFRIILDEAHNIRNKDAKTSRAIFSLKLSRKWALTGSPIVNKLDDFYSLIKFLEIEPWSNNVYWKTFVTLPYEQRQFSRAFEVVKSILNPIFIRRTKSMKTKSGDPIVSLPQKSIRIEYVNFSSTELAYYNALKSRASQSFRESLERGDLMRKYTQILTHILRLRQACCHLRLIKSHDRNLYSIDDIKDENKMVEDVEACSQAHLGRLSDVSNELFDRLRNSINLETSECSICTQSPISLNSMAITPCCHTFCLSCILDHVSFQENNKQQPLCPNCRRQISTSMLFKVKLNLALSKTLPYEIPEGRGSEASLTFQLYDPSALSSKIDALIRHISSLSCQTVPDHVVVFSQFSSFLDIIEEQLKNQLNDKVIVYKFDGRLKMQERHDILSKFEKPPENTNTVLLLSLKAGGVGLNLTTASKVFLMDPWWSPSVEEQAIDRIHRIGQKKNVTVTRFIMKDSIETKIIKIQERKKFLGEVVGIGDEDKKRRLDDIKTLFED